MARFVFTLNLPTATGKLVQETVGEHPATSVDDLFKFIEKRNWVPVDQMYQFDRTWKSRGKVLLNTAVIGKVRLFVENVDDDDV